MNAAKSLAAAQFILDSCAVSGDQSVTPMQLIKLVYIAHGYMLGRHGTPLLHEAVEAWQYGPVVPSVYHAVKMFRSSPVTHVPGAIEHDFSASEREIMEAVAEVYGKINAIQLSSATHKLGTPWRQTWEAFGKNAPISNDLIEAFYGDLMNKTAISAL